MRKYFAGGIDFAMQATSLEVGNGLEIKDVTAGGMLTKLRDGLSKKVYSVIAAVKLRQEVEIYSKKNLKEEKAKDIYRGLKGLTAQQTIEILQQGEQPRFRKVDGMREGRNWVFQISGLLDKNTLSTTTKFSSARMYAFWSYFYEKHYQTKSMASTVVVTAQSHLRQAMMVFKDLGLKMFDYRFVTKDKVVLHGKPSEVLKQIQEMVSKNNRGLSINLVYRAQVQPEQIKWKALRLGHYLAPTGQEMGVNQVFPEDLKEVWAYVAVNDNAMTTQGDPNLADLSRQIDLIRAPEEAANLANQLEAMDILTWRLIEGHVKDDGVLKDLLKELIGKKFINLELAHKADVYKELGFFRFNSQKSQEIVAQLVNQQTNVAEDEMKKLMTAQQSGEPIRNLIARYGELLVQVVVLKDKYFDFERTAFGENLARFFEYVINQENVGVSITPAIKVEAENIAKLIRTRAINETAYFKTKAELEGVIDRDEVDGIKARVESVMMVAIARGLVYSDTEEIVTGEGVAALAKYAKELKSLAKSDKQQEVVVALTEVGQKVDFWPNENQMPQAYLAWGKFLQLYEGLSDDKAMKTTENIIAPSVALTDDGVKQAIDVLIGKNISIGELELFINGFGLGDFDAQMRIFQRSVPIKDALDHLATQTTVLTTGEKVVPGFRGTTVNEYWEMANELQARWAIKVEGDNILEQLNKLTGITISNIEEYFDVRDDVTNSDSLNVGKIAAALTDIDTSVGHTYSNSPIQSIKSNYKKALKEYVINGFGKKTQQSEDFLIGTTRLNIPYKELVRTLFSLQEQRFDSSDLNDYSLAFQFGSPAAKRGVDVGRMQALEEILNNLARKVTIKSTGRKIDLDQTRANDDYWELTAEVIVQLQAIEIVNNLTPQLRRYEDIRKAHITDYFANKEPISLLSGPDLVVAQIIGTVTSPYRKVWDNYDEDIKGRFRTRVRDLLIKYWPEDSAMTSQQQTIPKLKEIVTKMFQQEYDEKFEKDNAERWGSLNQLMQSSEFITEWQSLQKLSQQQLVSLAVEAIKENWPSQESLTEQGFKFGLMNAFVGNNLKEWLLTLSLAFAPKPKALARVLMAAKVLWDNDTIIEGSDVQNFIKRIDSKFNGNSRSPENILDKAPLFKFGRSLHLNSAQRSYKNFLKILENLEIASQYILYSDDSLGGIDLSENQLPLTIRQQGDSIDMVVDEKILAQLEKAQGLTPNILSIKAINDIGNFLGVTVAPSI